MDGKADMPAKVKKITSAIKIADPAKTDASQDATPEINAVFAAVATLLHTSVSCKPSVLQKSTCLSSELQ